MSKMKKTVKPEHGSAARIGTPREAAPAARPRVEIDLIPGDGWYVVVNGHPVARHETQEDAEACARNW